MTIFLITLNNFSKENLLFLIFCHNLLQLQGTICFDSASQRLRPTVPTFFWLSHTDQSNNTQILRTENNNDSVTVINNNNNNNNDINFMIIIDLTGLSWM